MEDESKLGQILSKEGFNKQNGSSAVCPVIKGQGLQTFTKYEFASLNSLLDVHLDMGAEELIIKVTKIKDSQVYSCDFYKKE